MHYSYNFKLTISVISVLFRAVLPSVVRISPTVACINWSISTDPGALRKPKKLMHIWHWHVRSLCGAKCYGFIYLELKVTTKGDIQLFYTKYTAFSSKCAINWGVFNFLLNFCLLVVKQPKDILFELQLLIYTNFQVFAGANFHSVNFWNMVQHSEVVWHLFRRDKLRRNWFKTVKIWFLLIGRLQEMWQITAMR